MRANLFRSRRYPDLWTLRSHRTRPLLVAPLAVSRTAPPRYPVAHDRAGPATLQNLDLYLVLPFSTVFEGLVPQPRNSNRRGCQSGPARADGRSARAIKVSTRLRDRPPRGRFAWRRHGRRGPSVRGARGHAGGSRLGRAGAERGGCADSLELPLERAAARSKPIIRR